MKLRLVVILAFLLIWAGCLNVPSESVIGPALNDAGERLPPEYYFPRGSYDAQIFSAFMRPIGSGVVTIGVIEESYLLNVISPQGRSYRARISKDLSQCVFFDRVTLSSTEDFVRKTGGALGKRIDRVWSSDRFMVLVGVTLDDGKHVIYLRDRVTNDPLLIAKFTPGKLAEAP